jgi:hypothetical protein
MCLDPADPEDADVIAILKRLEAKAKAATPTPIGSKTPCFKAGISSQSDVLPTNRPKSHKEPVTILLKPETRKTDGRSRRKKYASRAEQQRAYRERKAAPQASTAA